MLPVNPTRKPANSLNKNHCCAVQAAATCAIYLWMQLQVADPIRHLYWRHRYKDGFSEGEESHWYE